MDVQDRIKELRRVPAGELIPNPKNWRIHPETQQDGLRAVLERVGYADAVIARETDAGLMLIDGHLRAETTPDAILPVLVTDLTEAEADEVLATLDPLAALAEPNVDQLAQLLSGIEGPDESIQALLEDIGDSYGFNASTLLEQATDAAYQEPDARLQQYEANGDVAAESLKALVLHFGPERYDRVMEMAFAIGEAKGLDSLPDVVYDALEFVRRDGGAFGPDEATDATR
jgi:hypothetical protein